MEVTPEFMAKVQYLSDRQEILDCLTRPLRAMDRVDKELFLTCFHDDALLDAGGFLNTPERVYEGSVGLHTAQSSTLHNLLNHICEIDGDTAHSETYLLFTGVNHDKTNWVVGGRYLDRFERRDGGPWKIAFRYTIIEWSGEIPPTRNPMFEGIADIYTNGAPSRSRDDPSYRRPLTNLRAMREWVNPD